MLRLMALMAVFVVRAAMAQEATANPAAMEAFSQFLKGFRAHDAVTVKSSVVIKVKEKEAERSDGPVEAEFQYALGEGKPRRAIAKLRGFTCWSSDGHLNIVHESNPHTYYTVEDDDSPFYAMFNAFRDLPFPDLAIALGNDEPDQVVMQLHPRAPEVVAKSVEDVTKDGKSLRKIEFAGEHEQLDLFVDPKANLPISLEAVISGGGFVPNGATVRYLHTFDCSIPDQPLADEAFHFDPKERQRVDVLASVVKAAAQPEQPDGPGGPQGGQANAMIGQPAPGFALATADGKAVDLANLKGQVIVLDFWATWCPPCREALPELHKVAAWAKEKQLPVAVWTVNTFERNENPDLVLNAVREFWTTKKYTLPIAMDYSGATAGAYGIQGIPATFVIRSDGVVHAVHSGFSQDYADSLKTEIQAAIDALEGKPAPGAGR